MSFSGCLLFSLVCVPVLVLACGERVSHSLNASWTASHVQLVACVATGKAAHLSTQWVVDPSRGKWEQRGAQAVFWGTHKHLRSLGNRVKGEVLNSLLFYYIYVENLALPLLSAVWPMTVLHEWVFACDSSQPVATVGMADLSSCEVQEEESILVIQFGHE